MEKQKWLYSEYFDCNDRLHCEIITATEEAILRKINRASNRVKKYLTSCYQEIENDLMIQLPSEGYQKNILASDGQMFIYKAVLLDRVRKRELK